MSQGIITGRSEEKLSYLVILNLSPTLASLCKSRRERGSKVCGNLHLNQPVNSIAYFKIVDINERSYKKDMVEKIQR